MLRICRAREAIDSRCGGDNSANPRLPRLRTILVRRYIVQRSLVQCGMRSSKEAKCKVDGNSTNCRDNARVTMLPARAEPAGLGLISRRSADCGRRREHQGSVDLEVAFSRNGGCTDPVFMVILFSNGYHSSAGVFRHVRTYCRSARASAPARRGRAGCSR
jgi:hypothetical protein